MKAEKFSRALEQVDDRYVMEAAQAAPAGRAATLVWKRWAAAAACLCLLAAGGAMALHFTAPATAPIVQAAPAADSPDGMRRFMNFGGLRYEFLENGAVYDIPEEQLGEVLGTLTFDIVSDPQANAQKDLAATYALGGTVRELKGCDPDFRVAVEYEGGFYLCQSTGCTDGRDMDMAAYFAAAGFAENVEGVAVYDHSGASLLTELPGEETEAFVSALAQCVPAQLSEEQYQQIGRAQREGGSFRVVFDLADGTQYGFYLIPSLDVAMFGDGRYTLPQDFSASFGGYFEGLVQGPQPMQ